MFWPVRFAFKVAWRLRLMVLAALAGLGAGLYLQLREEQRTWGVRPADADRGLPGDDLVASPTIEDTRSLTIEAAPAQVWPWLVQMGYGRGGWYSYDRIDMLGASAESILEEHQHLAVGDLMPTDPGGGFVAKVVEPAEALVLYLDTELVHGQRETEAARESGSTATVGETMPGPLNAVGALGGFTMPEFRASWAFVLEPEVDGSTRLVERFRVWTAEAGRPQQLGMPIMGVGVFLMTRQHMLGLKERAEHLAEADASSPHQS